MLLSFDYMIHYESGTAFWNYRTKSLLFHSRNSMQKKNNLLTNNYLIFSSLNCHENFEMKLFIKSNNFMLESSKFLLVLSSTNF